MTVSKTTTTAKTNTASTSKTSTRMEASSSTDLDICDVSHLPLESSAVGYTVTETLPAGGGEKITVYGEGGATSTEYRHSVTQEESGRRDAAITQISSTVNRSMPSLSQESGSTYTVTEPREEIRLTYNKNDSGWNGKFTYEQPVSRKDKVVKHSSTSTSHQESSSLAKSSSSSYVIEIVDGKERIVDKKHHESAHATSSSNDERLSTRSGTSITPEVHYSQKAKDSETRYDTANPELTHPKTHSSEAVREVHQVGDSHSSTAYTVRDNAAIPLDHKGTIKDKSAEARIDTNWDDSFVLEKSDKTNRHKQSASDSRNFYGYSSSDTKTTSSKAKDSGEATTTTTITYYDSKGNVIKTVTDVDTRDVPGSERTKTGTYTDSVDTKDKQIINDKSTASENINVCYESGTSKDFTDTRRSQATTGVQDIYGTDHTEDATSSSTIGRRITESEDIRKSQLKTDSRDFYGKDKTVQDSKSTTYYVDENYVDTSKLHNTQMSSDSKNFYGHGIDSSKTVVKNIYDDKAIQNTIGTKGKVIKDNTIDSTDVVYSNERNYGKTGWNGKFTYETPAKPK